MCKCENCQPLQSGIFYCLRYRQFSSTGRLRICASDQAEQTWQEGLDRVSPQVRRKMDELTY